MNHSLTSLINISTATTRARRKEARRIFARARKYRARAIKAVEEEQERLFLRVHGVSDIAEDIRKRVKEGTSDRRAMHLAAALLNGKTYNQAESKRDARFEASHVAKYLATSLRKAERKHATQIAERWLKDGNVRLQHIREKGLMRLLARDQQQAKIDKMVGMIEGLGNILSYNDKRVKTAQSDLQRAQKAVGVTTAEVAELKMQLTELKMDMDEADGAADDSACDGVSDLLNEASDDSTPTVRP